MTSISHYERVLAVSILVAAHTSTEHTTTSFVLYTTLQCTQVFIRVAHGTEDPEARTAVSVLRQRSASDVNKKGFNSNGDPVLETKSDVPDVPYAMTATAEGVKRLQRQRSDSTLANTEVCIRIHTCSYNVTNIVLLSHGMLCDKQ
jgi:hypothetical protein